MVLFHCQWVYKGRTDVSELVYRLGWGPWHHKRVGFGVSQEPGISIAQISAERLGAAMGDEVADCVRGAFPLPMGIQREEGQM